MLRPRRAVLPCLAAIGLAACGRAPAPTLHLPPPAPPLAAATAAPIAAAPDIAPAPAPPSAPLPPWIQRVADPACSWGTERWRRRSITLLRLRPDGPVFARVAGGKARAHVPVGAAGHATVDVGSNGLVVSGFVARADVPLFAASEFAMNGVLFPRSSTPLSWSEGFAASISVTMATPKDIVVNNPPLTAKRPCAELSLDSGAALTPAKAAFGKEHGSARVLRAGSTEVFGDPSRPADVKLVLPQRAFVQVFATSGAFSRIGVQHDQVYVAGWIRTSNLGETWSGGSGTLGGIGGVGIGQGRPHSLRKVACPADVPLVVDVSGERATVGHVMTGTPIDVTVDGDDFSRVRIENRNILPESAFLLRTSDLRGCHTLAR
jgi:hypothetical protein